MRRTWTDEQLIEAVSTNKTMSAVVLALGLVARGSNFKTMKRHIKRLSLDTTHFDSRAIRLEKFNRYKESVRKADNEFFCIREGKVGGAMLKNRLLKGNHVENKCAECEIKPEWNGKTLVLQVDHINGNSLDNTIENLRLLCPNCHSQTINFAGRKCRLPKLVKPKAPVNWRRRPFLHRRKCDHDAVRVQYSILKNYCAVAKIFNVSEMSVRKIVKNLGAGFEPAMSEKTSLSKSDVVTNFTTREYGRSAGYDPASQVSQTCESTISSSIAILNARVGLEPTSSSSEDEVLPLDDPAIQV